MGCGASTHTEPSSKRLAAAAAIAAAAKPGSDYAPSTAASEDSQLPQTSQTAAQQRGCGSASKGSKDLDSGSRSSSMARVAPPPAASRQDSQATGTTVNRSELVGPTTAASCPAGSAGSSAQEARGIDAKDEGEDPCLENSAAAAPLPEAQPAGNEPYPRTCSRPDEAQEDPGATAAAATMVGDQRRASRPTSAARQPAGAATGAEGVQGGTDPSIGRNERVASGLASSRASSRPERGSSAGGARDAAAVCSDEDATSVDANLEVALPPPSPPPPPALLSLGAVTALSGEASDGGGAVTHRGGGDAGPPVAAVPPPRSTPPASLPQAAAWPESTKLADVEEGEEEEEEEAAVEEKAEESAPAAVKRSISESSYKQCELSAELSGASEAVSTANATAPAAAAAAAWAQSRADSDWLMGPGTEAAGAQAAPADPTGASTAARPDSRARPASAASLGPRERLKLGVEKSEEWGGAMSEPTTSRSQLMSARAPALAAESAFHSPERLKLGDEGQEAAVAAAPTTATAEAAKRGDAWRRAAEDGDAFVDVGVASPASVGAKPISARVVGDGGIGGRGSGRGDGRGGGDGGDDNDDFELETTAVASEPCARPSVPKSKASDSWDT